MGRRFKFSKGFAKQEMVKRAVGAGLDVYDLLHNRTDNINQRGLFKIEEKFNGLMEGSIKDATLQERQYINAKSKMYVLRLIQIKRREKLLQWFDKYLKKIEGGENNHVIKKYAFGLEKEYKIEIMNSFYDEFEDYSQIIEQLKCICGYTDLMLQEQEESVSSEEGEEQAPEEETEESLELEGEKEEETEESDAQDASGEAEEVEEQVEESEAGDSTLSEKGGGSEEPATLMPEKEEKNEFVAFFVEDKDCGEKGTNEET